MVIFVGILIDPRMESGTRKGRGFLLEPDCSMRFFYGGEL